MAAGLQLRNVRIAVGIVDELVMGQVLQAIMLRGAEQREHAEEIGNQIVEEPIAKQNMVGGFMSQARKLMLACPDQMMARMVTGTFHHQLQPSSVCR